MNDQATEALDLPPRLVELGWDERWARVLPTGAGEVVPGRVVAQHRGLYRVAGAEGEQVAVPAGRLRREAGDASFPAVGDWVATTTGGQGGRASIVHLLPRRGAFVRRRPGTEQGAQVIAANVDLAVVVAPLGRPVNVRRLERLLALAWESGALPLVALTKADLCADPLEAVATAAAVSPGVDVLPLSAATGAGVEELRTHLRPRRTVVLLGPSGAGKSTLTNLLLGEDRLRTREVRADGKGRHATTHRELFRLPGGALLIDTPGVREVGLLGTEDGLRSAFAEIEALAAECRFADCRHGAEPGCAVLRALRSGELDPARMESWRRLEREAEYLERRENMALAAARRARDRALHRAARAELRRRRGG